MKRRALLAALFILAGSPFLDRGAAQSLRTASISDASLNGIKAFTVTIPANWKFQGTVVRGPECAPISAPVFRAYSPDGLSEIRLLPAFSWSFHPALGNRTVAGCLLIQQTLTAQQFLDHFVEVIPGGVHVVGPMAIAPLYRDRVEKVAAN